MGLGLSITYGLVQSFGGHDPRGECAGGGAEFTVELEPWRGEGGSVRAANDVWRSGWRPSPHPPSRRGRAMIRRVLLVDDDAAVREALGQTLELADCEATGRGSLRRGQGPHRAGLRRGVVSDIRMPGRDGFHLLDHARAADPDLPVILLTGEGDIPMAVRAMAAAPSTFSRNPARPAI